MMLKNSKVVCGAIVTLVFLAAGLFLINSDTINKLVSKNTSNIITIRHTDYPVTDNLSDLVSGSEYIVQGYYTKFDSSWNMARNPENIQEEATNLYVEGHKYEFIIEKCYKGNIKKDSKIFINIQYSRNGVVDEKYIEPLLGETMVLFLNKDVNFDNYYASMEPYQFLIDGAKLKVKTKLNNLKDKFEKNIDIKRLNVSP